MALQRLYMLKAKAVVSVAIQAAKAIEYGFKREEIADNGGYDGNRVYIDQRMAGQDIGDWLDELIRQTRKGDVIHIYDLTVLGSKEAQIAERLAAVGDAGGAVRVMATDLLIKPSAESTAVISALRDARKAVGAKRAKIMRAAKLKSGVDQGGRPFRFTPAEREKVKGAWQRAKTQTEALLLAKDVVGRPVSYSQMFRWAHEFGWGTRGKRGRS